MYGPQKMTPRKKTPFSLHQKDQGADGRLWPCDDDDDDDIDYLET